MEDHALVRSQTSPAQTPSTVECYATLCYAMLHALTIFVLVCGTMIDKQRMILLGAVAGDISRVFFSSFLVETSPAWHACTLSAFEPLRHGGDAARYPLFCPLLCMFTEGCYPNNIASFPSCALAFASRFFLHTHSNFPP